MPSRRHPPSDRTTLLLKSRIRTVFRHYPKAVTGDEEAIHQLRVSGRRLRDALPLLARRARGKRVRRVDRALKRLIRTAGAGRDLDVMLALFEAETGKPAAARPEVKVLRRRLRGARRRRRRQMAEALLDLDIASLRADLRKIESQNGDAPAIVLARVAATRDEQGRALLEAIAQLGDRFQAPALHRIRIRTRRLRYSAEIDAAVRGGPDQAASRFKELQELFGRINDSYLLARWLGDIATRLERRGEPALAAEARRQAARFIRLSRRCFRELRSRDFPALVRAALVRLGRDPGVFRGGVA